MNKWRPLTKRVFKGVFKEPEPEEQPPRECLANGSAPQPDCPNQFETFVNAFSTSLRASERTCRLVELAEKLSKLLGIICYHAEMETVKKDVRQAAEAALKETALVHPQFSQVNITAVAEEYLLNVLSEQVNKLLLAKFIDSVQTALRQFNAIDPLHFGNTENNIFTTLRRGNRDVRPIVHLAGIAERQPTEKRLDYQEHVNCLWQYVRQACLTKKTLLTNSGWGTLPQCLLSLLHLVKIEAEKTTKAQCEFLEQISGDADTLGQAIDRFDLDRAMNFVWSDRPASRPTSTPRSRRP